MYWKSPDPAGFIFYSFCYYWEKWAKSIPIGNCRFVYFYIFPSLFKVILVDAYTFKIVIFSSDLPFIITKYSSLFIVMLCALKSLSSDIKKITLT